MTPRKACFFWGMRTVLIVSLGLAGSHALAQSPVWVARVITKLPRTEAELAAAHEESTNPAQQIAVGEPLEVFDFAGRTEYDVTIREEGKAVAAKLPYEFCRLGVVSYGMRVLPADQENLPAVARNRIMGRVEGNYISLQVRVQRDPTGNVYLYYKPFAAVGTYGSEGTQEFAALMEDSVRNVRGLGLWVAKTDRPSAEAFRTFVGINKDTITVDNPDGGEPLLQPHYELFFVRLRERGGQYELHTFNTSEYRDRMNYLKPYEAPGSPEECSIESTIFFTEYTAAKQSPSAKASREIKIHPQSHFEMSRLDQYVADQGLDGDAFDHLNVVLDAIIDRQLEP